MNTPDSPRHTGERAFIQQLAKKHGVSESAVETLYAALQHGGGGMAQFNHPELGGYGQWMKSGMIMVGDMFNHALKAKVDALCHALLPHLDDGSIASSAASASMNSPFVRMESSTWWPSDYGAPAATGGQNNFRYAYFPAQEALVVEQDGKTEIYDTSGHVLHGFGQQQTSSSGFSLRSSSGPVDLSKLPKKKIAAK